MKKLKIIFFIIACSLFFTTNLQANIIKSIDLPNTKAYQYNNQEYLDIGYYFEVRKWWILGFGVKEQKWVLTVGESRFLNLSNEKFNNYLKFTNKTLPSDSFIDQSIALFTGKGRIAEDFVSQSLLLLKWIWAYSGIIIIALIIILFFYLFFEEKMKSLKEKRKKRYYQKNKPKIFKSAEVYARLMCKHFNTNPQYLVEILSVLKSIDNTKLNINVNISNKLESYSNQSRNFSSDGTPEFATGNLNKDDFALKYNQDLIQSLISENKLSNLYIPSGYYNSSYASKRNSFLIGQIKNMFNTVYGFDIFDEITTNDKDIPLQMNINCLVNKGGISTKTSNPTEGFVMPKITYIVDFQFNKSDKIINICEPIILSTEGLIVDTLNFYSMEDLYTKVSNLHTVKFTSDLINHLGILLKNTDINNKYEDFSKNYINKDIEKIINELKNTGKYTDEQINLIRKKLYIEKTPLKDKVSSMSSKDAEKGYKTLKDKVSKVVDDAKEDGYELADSLFELNEGSVSYAAEYIALGIAISQKEYSEALEAGIDIGIDALFS